VESKLNYKDENTRFQLQGYEFRRFDNAKSTYGIVVYYHSSIGNIDIQHEAVSHANGHVTEYVIIGIEQHDLCIVGLYSSPKTSFVELLSVLQRVIEKIGHFRPCNVMIVGDFNIDFLRCPTNTVTTFLKDYRQCITCPTTDYGSLLDHLYTNIDNEKLKINVLESYFSDHKGIVASLKH
jgi:hypothetical protein